MAQKQRWNPFYLLVGVLGFGFTITACAYGVMAYRAISPPLTPTTGEQTNPIGLMELMDRHGLAILAVELVLLGITSVLAMALDDYFQSPSKEVADTQRSPESPEAPGKS